MNEQYEKTLEIDGKTYYYDPDYDCYYRRYRSQDLGHADKYAWIYVILALTLICAIITYSR